MTTVNTPNKAAKIEKNMEKLLLEVSRLRDENERLWRVLNKVFLNGALTVDRDFQERVLDQLVAEAQEQGGMGYDKPCKGDCE